MSTVDSPVLPEMPVQSPAGAGARIIRDFLRQHWPAYAGALVMLLAIAVLNLSVPWLTGRTVDAIAAHQFTRADLVTIVLQLLGIGIVVYGLRYAWRSALYGASYRLGQMLRNAYYQRLLRLGPAFYQQHNTGDLMARATNDIDAVEMAAGEGVVSGFDGLMILLMVLVVMFTSIDWRLAAVALLPFPLMVAGFAVISARMQEQFDVSLARFSDLNDRTQEALSGIRLIKAMGREPVEMAAFNRIAGEAAAANMKVQWIEAWYDPLIFLVMALSMLLTLAFGGWLVVRGEMTVGKLTSFTMYLGQLIWPMFALGWLLNIVQRGRSALVRVNELLSQPDTLPDSALAQVGAAVIDPSAPALACDIRQFRYPAPAAQAQSTAEPPVAPCALHNINFSLSSGKVLGIVGPTGCGKSTLLQLLMRHYDTATDEADICVAGRALRDWPLDALRARFAWVPQDAFLFSRSLAENIALARPEATPDEIREAARLAALDDDIARLPQGLATQIGERGITLSGGQRQRVAIARALLQASADEAAILVLDDALSAVDVQTEREILQHLRAARAGQPRTAVIVSHRLSAVMDADEILVLSHGTVRCHNGQPERGTHAQLLALGGWYARMWAYQQLEAGLEADNTPDDSTDNRRGGVVR